MKTGKIVLMVLVLLVAFAMAYGHMPLALGLSSLFRPQGPRPPPPNSTSARPPSPRVSSFFLALGSYFLFATVIYIVGGILVATGKLFRLANIGLIIMALVDNVLLLYTRTMPNIFFGRILGWSWGWFPLGTGEVLIGQTVLIILCLALLYGFRTPSSPPKQMPQKAA